MVFVEQHGIRDGFYINPFLEVLPVFQVGRIVFFLQTDAEVFKKHRYATVVNDFEVGNHVRLGRQADGFHIHTVGQHGFFGRNFFPATHFLRHVKYRLETGVFGEALHAQVKHEEAQQLSAAFSLQGAGQNFVVAEVAREIPVVRHQVFFRLNKSKSRAAAFAVHLGNPVEHQELFGWQLQRLVLTHRIVGFAETSDQIAFGERKQFLPGEGRLVAEQKRVEILAWTAVARRQFLWFVHHTLPYGKVLVAEKSGAAAVHFQHHAVLHKTFVAEKKQQVVAAAHEAVDADVVPQGLSFKRQIVEEREVAVQQAVHVFPFVLEIDAEVADQQQVALTRLHTHGPGHLSVGRKRRVVRDVVFRGHERGFVLVHFGFKSGYPAYQKVRRHGQHHTAPVGIDDGVIGTENTADFAGGKSQEVVFIPNHRFVAEVIRIVEILQIQTVFSLFQAFFIHYHGVHVYFFWLCLCADRHVHHRRWRRVPFVVVTGKYGLRYAGMFGFGKGAFRKKVLMFKGVNNRFVTGSTCSQCFVQLFRFVRTAGLGFVKMMQIEVYTVGQKQGCHAVQVAQHTCAFAVGGYGQMFRAFQNFTDQTCAGGVGAHFNEDAVPVGGKFLHQPREINFAATDFGGVFSQVFRAYGHRGQGDAGVVLFVRRVFDGQTVHFQKFILQFPAKIVVHNVVERHAHAGKRVLLQQAFHFRRIAGKHHLVVGMDESQVYSLCGWRHHLPEPFGQGGITGHALGCGNQRGYPQVLGRFGRHVPYFGKQRHVAAHFFLKQRRLDEFAFRQA